jgi:hypothetical protein
VVAILRKPSVIFIGGILPIAILSNLFHLGHKSFWGDEAFSVHVASLDWGTFVNASPEQGSEHGVVLRPASPLGKAGHG